jgi:L-threonylcarbamoyladenylate synthase
MKKIKINTEKINRKEINLIIEYLKNGKIIIYPTDTIYGLGCEVTNKTAVKKIYKLKKRNEKKSFIILVASFKMLEKYCFVNNQQKVFLKKVWPGPVTAILASRHKLPWELGDSLAARLPNSKFLTTIIKKTGVPIISTSVNISGLKQDLKNFIKLSERSNELDLIIIGEPERKVKPSKIVDIRQIDKSGKNIKILRS